jgi:hypothetical protein
MALSRPLISFGGQKIAIDVPHLTFVTGIGGWSAWFCWDAWHASPEVENLILIVPISAAAILLYLFVAAQCFRPVDAPVARESRPRKPLAPGMGVKIAGSMALLAGFVVAGPLVGFDIASFFYMLGMMAFLGERRMLVLLLVPMVFCAVVIYCFNTLLATPLPLLFSRNAS